MNRNRYNISYGSPLTAKEQPHRELDTARTSHGPRQYADYDQTDTTQEVEAGDAVQILEPTVQEVES